MSDIMNLTRLEARIVDRIRHVGDCWEWQGHIPKDGYGRIYVEGRQWLAHRASYTAFVAEIEPELNLDHLCRNRRCVNPQHLEPVTQSVNLARSPLMGRQAHKTHCPQGHPYDAANTAVRNGGRRHCRTCDKGRWDTEKHNPMKPCPDCGKEMRKGNIKRHQASAHPTTRLGLDQP